MRWLLEWKALKELRRHRNQKLRMMSSQETEKVECDRNNRDSKPVSLPPLLTQIQKL